jgi:hypothetical protein
MFKNFLNFEFSFKFPASSIQVFCKYSASSMQVRNFSNYPKNSSNDPIPSKSPTTSCPLQQPPIKSFQQVVCHFQLRPWLDSFSVLKLTTNPFQCQAEIDRVSPRSRPRPFDNAFFCFQNTLQTCDHHANQFVVLKQTVQIPSSALVRQGQPR